MDAIGRILLQHTVCTFILTIAVVAIPLLGFEKQPLLVAVSAVLIGFIVVSLWTTTRLLIVESTMVWMPITVFVLSSALFFGVGPLAYLFGSDGTKFYLAMRTISATPADVARASKLALLGITLVFAGAVVTIHFTKDRLARHRAQSEAPRFKPEFLTAVFLAVGLFLKYAVWYPSVWGIVDFTVPGFVALFTALAALGFGLFAFVAFSRGGPIIILFMALWLADFIGTTLAFAKIDLMLALVFPIAGYFLATRKFVSTAALVAVALAVYTYSQPMVTYARIVGVADHSADSYADRAKIIYTYVTTNPDVPESARYWGSQRAWTRLETSGKDAYAMDLRDHDVTSRSLTQLPILFIPRLLWPDKPEIRGPGRDFYFLVTGRDTNRMTISVYADLYWQFGWLGVILLSPLIGFALILMTNKLLPHIRARDFAYLPLVLIGVRAGLLDPTQYVINGILTSVLYFTVYAAILSLAIRLLEESRSPTLAPARAIHG